MSIPNAGPHQPDPTDPGTLDLRRGNPALIYRDEPVTDDMAAASTRAATVSHRFGSVRHPLTHHDGFRPAQDHPTDGGDPDASH
jgi:hypothetical protein